MRHLFTVAAVLVAISFTPPTTHANILGLFGFDCYGGHNCGCGHYGRCGTGCGRGCACEPGCGCDQGCGSEVSCGCEPTCGCGTGCYANGRQYAGQKFHCGCRSYVPICPCTGPCDGGCCQGGRGNCCEPACGCEQGGCCEPTCGTGCGSCCEPCCSHKCCLKHCGFCSGCGYVVSALCCCAPCAGCSGETYWNEWHNDPPRCQDPCNCNGEWIGPGYGTGYCPSCGPYSGGVGAQSGSYSSNANASAVNARNHGANRSMVAQNGWSGQSQPVRAASRPANRAQVNPNNQPSRPIQW
jgi:hypothetical protein